MIVGALLISVWIAEFFKKLFTLAIQRKSSAFESGR